MKLVITGMGCVTPQGLGPAALSEALEAEEGTFVEEEPRPGTVVRVGRVGRIKSEAAAAAYKRWGQLDTYSRYGFLAAFQALEQAGVTMGDPVLTDFGVMLGTSYGCMEENQRFDRFDVRDGKVHGASPLVFKGTVDNAPAGWIAVAWRIKGPNATFVSGDGAALEALWSAEGVLRAGRASAVLVGGVERFVDLHLLLRRPESDRQGTPLSEGAGLLLVETEASAASRGAKPLARVAGTCRRRGDLVGAMMQAFSRFGVDPTGVGLVSLALPFTDERSAAVFDAVPGAEVVADKEALGEFHGAWGGIAVAAALGRRTDTGWNGRPLCLVHAFGEGDEHFFVLLETPSEGPGSSEEA